MKKADKRKIVKQLFEQPCCDYLKQCGRVLTEQDIKSIVKKVHLPALYKLFSV